MKTLIKNPPAAYHSAFTARRANIKIMPYWTLGSENPDEEYGKFFKKEKRITSDYFNWFYQFSLFPQIGYDEKKVEARIQAWLDKNH